MSSEWAGFWLFSLVGVAIGGFACYFLSMAKVSFALKHAGFVVVAFFVIFVPLFFLLFYN